MSALGPPVGPELIDGVEALFRSSLGFLHGLLGRLARRLCPEVGGGDGLDKSLGDLIVLAADTHHYLVVVALHAGEAPVDLFLFLPEYGFDIAGYWDIVGSHVSVID